MNIAGHLFLVVILRLESMTRGMQKRMTSATELRALEEMTSGVFETPQLPLGSGLSAGLYCS